MMNPVPTTTALAFQDLSYPSVLPKLCAWFWQPVKSNSFNKEYRIRHWWSSTKMKVTAKQNGNQKKSQNQWFLAHLIQISIKILLLIKKRKLILKSVHNSASFFIILLQITLISPFIHLCPSLVFCFGSSSWWGTWQEPLLWAPTLVETLAAIVP